MLPLEEYEPKQDETVHHDVYIGLEQIFTGCTKRVKLTRNILEAEGNELEEEKILTLDIKPGTTSGTVFTFPREGDQRPGCVPADIDFMVLDKPHPLFRRIGSDIEHTVTLSKSELSNGGCVEVPTLDGPTKEISLEGIVNEKSTRKLANFGLPIPDKQGKRGMLIVKFKIVEGNADCCFD